MDYETAVAAQRTAASWQQWRNDRVTHAAVAWVLMTVLARHCEDNALVTPRWFGGATADERGLALDARRSYTFSSILSTPTANGCTTSSRTSGSSPRQGDWWTSIHPAPGLTVR